MGQFVDASNQAAWGVIKQTDQQINNTCKRVEEDKQKRKTIDWAYWEKEIAHKDLVKWSAPHPGLRVVLVVSGVDGLVSRV